LDEYREKRDFLVTPEPSEAEATPGGALSYVVQKHAASHLHYDFRIELDGVLLSWAVPKGPSLDPADKRLAVHVEDHPVAYATFEGAIPAGEYGGGTVMVWDRGTWTPDHGDPREHLAQGHLKFSLEGERLRGRWMLVRTKGYGSRSQDSWLLFKERDDEARSREKFDATTVWTTSVLSGRTMDEIATSPDRELSQVEGAHRTEPPRELDVQLATLSKRVPDGDQWLHEVKYDGYRIVAFLEDGAVRLTSRNGRDWTERLSVVAQAVARLPARSAVLDGEVVVIGPGGVSDFSALQEAVREGGTQALAYQVFDLVYLDGFDLRATPLAERKRLLRQLLPVDPVLRYTDHIEGHGDSLLDSACGLALEGVVSKRRGAPYRSGRGHGWLKTKCVLRQEFVVIGWTDPQGSQTGFGALLLGLREGERLLDVGRVGGGFSEADVTEISKRLVSLATARPPVSDSRDGAVPRGVHWVEPRLVVEVEFAERTPQGALRHPVFKGVREDKAADDVVEEVAEDPESLGGVRITHSTRVLWPEVSLTKFDLAQYYEAVAEHMLPHVGGRPLSLVRCPSGVGGECFFQKHASGFPDSVRMVTVDGGEVADGAQYAVVDDVAGLLGLAQMAVVEVHPWGSRVGALDSPDRLVFDLDPDPALPFAETAVTALLLRSELARLDLASWVKSTGGKGLHVVVPVDPCHTWDEVRSFARAFTDRIVSMEPRRFTGLMRASQREGRILIDRLRNARGATAVGPLSPRARAGAPVSVPLFWEELDGLVTVPDFTLTSLPQRLADLTADPWEGFLEKRQVLPSHEIA
jgi:bifunctional non-homologous end joining protein LigD